MKIRSFFVLILILNIISNGAAQPISWYKEIRGKIGNYPITMHLHKYANTYAGFYYYDTQQNPIPFFGDDTTETGWIRLTAWLPDMETEETLRFSLGDSLIGNWKNNTSPGPLPFLGKINVDTSKCSFLFIYTEGSRKLRSSLQDSPEAFYEAGTIWPVKNTPRYSLLQKWIGESFGIKNLKDDIGKYLEEMKHEFLDEYMKENKDLKDMEIREFGFSLNAAETSRLMVVYHSDKLLTLAHYGYTYSGGAHGNYGTIYSNYDLLTNKKLKWTDLITNEGKLQLPKLLEKVFRQTRKLSATESLTEGGLFENSILPNDNFYITGKGIGFSYVPYEIGPYAAGEIKIFIPSDALSKYLTPLGKKWME